MVRYVLCTMYPLQARAEPFLFVAASLSVRTAQRGLAYHQVRDTEPAPHRISYKKRVPSTCLCYCSPVNTKDTRTRTTRQRIPTIGAKRLDLTPLEPEGQHKTRHPFSQQLTGSSRAPRRCCRAGADRKAGGGHGVGEMKQLCFSTGDLNRSLGGSIEGYLGPGPPKDTGGSRLDRPGELLLYSTWRRVSEALAVKTCFSLVR